LQNAVRGDVGTKSLFLPLRAKLDFCTEIELLFFGALKFIDFCRIKPKCLSILIVVVGQKL
tara:strand:+ start:108 stop:290 length:183 start_codon:yes stop_codon:yes gene_type:complete